MVDDGNDRALQPPGFNPDLESFLDYFSDAFLIQEQCNKNNRFSAEYARKHYENLRILTPHLTESIFQQFTGKLFQRPSVFSLHFFERQLFGDIFNLILFIQALFDAFFRDLPFR
jgi:hypothetical protein